MVTKARGTTKVAATRKRATVAETAPAIATATATASKREAHSLVMPGGRWTVMRFGPGAPAAVIEALVTGAIVAAKAERAPGAKWVASLGEFFMGEGEPVVLLSPQVPKTIVQGLSEFFAVLGGVRVRKDERSSLAFRGETLVWIEDGFEKVSGSTD